MIRVEYIDHIVLRTTRPQILIDFYRDVLGCAPERALPPEAGLVQLRAGNALIDIVDVHAVARTRQNRQRGRFLEINRGTVGVA